MTTVNLAPIAVALDTPDLDTARLWAGAAAPSASTMKVGLELFLRHGAAAVSAVRDASGNRDVFLDLKLHDIPNTVAGAARSLAPLAPTYLTVHAAGGTAMIRAAVEVLPETRIAAVTVLTSLDDDNVSAVGFAGSPRDVVRRLARLAVEAGARAIVCSPAEVADVRREVGPDVVLVTPGVRFADAAPSDQARVATASEALSAGADLLVVGRPITAAADIATAARRVAEELGSA